MYKLIGAEDIIANMRASAQERENVFSSFAGSSWGTSTTGGWKDFAARNPDLFQKELLQEIYEPAVLQSTLARQTFILPRKLACTTPMLS